MAALLIPVRNAEKEKLLNIAVRVAQSVFGRSTMATVVKGRSGVQTVENPSINQYVSPMLKPWKGFSNAVLYADIRLRAAGASRINNHTPTNSYLKHVY